MTRIPSHPIGRAVVPIAIALFFFGMILYGSGIVAADPNGVCICPTCKQLQCGSCPTSGLTLTSSVQANSTNVTVSFKLRSNSAPTSALANLNWGPNTSYAYPAGSNEGVGTTQFIYSFINYLAPTSRYYYQVYAWASCSDSIGNHNYHAWLNSTWTTGTDNLVAFTGTVFDSNGAHDPGNLYMAVRCVSSGTPFTYYLTTSTGFYNLTVWNPYTGWACDGAYYVSVENWPVDWTDLGVYSSVWTGHWNETIVTYAPQVLNFYMPVNYLSPMTPMVLDYTNDAYVSFDYATGLVTTTTSSWEFEGQGENTSFTSSNMTQLSSAPSENLEYYVAYDVTGATVFNAETSRIPQVSTWSYVGMPLSSNQSSNRVSDPVTPFYDSTLKNETCYAKSQGQSGTYYTSYSQSYQLTSTFNLDLSLSLDLGHGLSISSSVLTYSNSISNGGGRSWTLSYTIDVPHGDPTTNVWVYVQPGVTNQVGPVVHAWTGPSCPELSITGPGVDRVGQTCPG